MYRNDKQPVIIIGGGPAGLTAAFQLMKLGYPSIVVEKGHTVGGIARTENYKGYRIDIGGHRFYTKVDEVREIWHEVMGADFLTRPRLSRIYYNRKFYYYPLRFFNVLANLGLWESGLILLSYLYAQIFSYSPENTFEEWVSNRFGRRLYRIFFKTYTEKVWGIPCNEITAEWAAQRIKGLSLPTAVRNALLGSQGQTIKTLIESFEYPRLGPGMLWERVKDLLEAAGNPVLVKSEVVQIHHNGSRVWGVTVASNGEERIIEGSHVISSMPLNQLISCLEPASPAEIVANATRLTYRDFLTVALIINRPDVFPDNWIYIHAPEVRVGRIQNFKNWSPEMAADVNKTCLGLEYFCNEGDTLWSMSDKDLIDLGRRELEQIGLIKAGEVEDGVVFRQAKAYPIYTGEYKTYLEHIQTYLKTFGNLQTIGRNGLHMYNNQDHSMLTAILAVRNLWGECHDVWTVNVERAYYEEVRLPSKTA